MARANTKIATGLTTVQRATLRTVPPFAARAPMRTLRGAPRAVIGLDRAGERLSTTNRRTIYGRTTNSDTTSCRPAQEFLPLAPGRLPRVRVIRGVVPVPPANTRHPAPDPPAVGRPHQIKPIVVAVRDQSAPRTGRPRRRTRRQVNVDRVRNADGGVALDRDLVPGDDVLGNQPRLNRAERPLELFPREQVPVQVPIQIEPRRAGLSKRRHRDRVREQEIKPVPVLMVITPVDSGADLDDLQPVRDRAQVGHDQRPTGMTRPPGSVP